MVKDIRKYLCSREECLTDIKESINKCSRKELVNIISQSDLVRMEKRIRNTFFECNYDELGNVFLFDEIAPKLIAEYIWDNINLEIDKDIVYAYVCRTQMRIINSFYKEITQNKIIWRYSYKQVKNIDKCRDKYFKLVMNRLDFPIKRLRGV